MPARSATRPHDLGAVRHDAVRRHNSARVLRLVHIRGGTTRSGIASATGLNRSTVGALTSELAVAGLVREVRAAPGGVGRPSIVVEPATDRVHVLAVNISVDRTVVAVVGIGGVVIDHAVRKHRRTALSPRQILAEIRALVATLDKRRSDSLRLGMCISVPGLVRQEDDTVRFAPNLGWEGVPFADLVRADLKLRTPVRIANEADLGGLAEHLRGSAAGTANLLYLYGDVGVGGAAIIDGRLLIGAGGYTGEVGHMVVNPLGAACRCGSRGCWETEIGEDAVAAALGAAGEVLDARQVAELAAARRGDPLAEVGRWLGLGVANLVNVLNPEVVLFGGLLRGVLPITEPHVRDALASSLVASHGEVRLEPASLGDDSNLIGAAERAFAPLLEDPLGVMERTRAGAGRRRR